MLVVLTLSGLFAAALAQTYSAVGTFNDYQTQGLDNNACHYNADSDGKYGGYYAVAIGDLSPNLWSGPGCNGGQPNTSCNGQSGYGPGPSCDESSCGNTCGRCVQICNGSNCAVAKVVDACPWESQYNYCKTDIDPSQRCSANNTNAVDIDIRLKPQLGYPEGNINAQVQYVSC